MKNIKYLNVEASKKYNKDHDMKYSIYILINKLNP